MGGAVDLLLHWCKIAYQNSVSEKNWMFDIYVRLSCNNREGVAMGLLKVHESLASFHIQRPSLVKYQENGAGVLPFEASDLVLSPSQWSSHVVGKISSWIDLDSDDEVVRMDSEIALKQEIAWASQLSLQICFLTSSAHTESDGIFFKDHKKIS